MTARAPRRRPAARGLRARRAREIANITRLAGPRMKSLPWHLIYQRALAGGTASPQIVAAAEVSRRQWA